MSIQAPNSLLSPVLNTGITVNNSLIFLLPLTFNSKKPANFSGNGFANVCVILINLTKNRHFSTFLPNEV